MPPALRQSRDVTSKLTDSSVQTDPYTQLCTDRPLHRRSCTDSPVQIGSCTHSPVQTGPYTNRPPHRQASTHTKSYTCSKSGTHTERSRRLTHSNICVCKCTSGGSKPATSVYSRKKESLTDCAPGRRLVSWGYPG